MAGPLDIQRFPKGLIDLLGMKATGDTPHALGQEIGGELDVLDYFLADRVSYISGSFAAVISASGNFQFVGMTVPPGEIWLTYSFGYEIPTIAPATAVRAYGVIFRQDNSAAQPSFVMPVLDLPASTAGAQGAVWEKPILVRTGQSFGLRILGVTGAPNATPTGNVWAARIQI